MRKFLIAAALVSCAAVSIRAQTSQCPPDPRSREPSTYTVYDYSSSLGNAISSFGRIPPATCRNTTANNIVIFNCKKAGGNTFLRVNFSDPSSVATANFNYNINWTFVIHGWVGSCFRGNNEWEQELCNVLSYAETSNVCCVDWSEWAKCLYYSDADYFVYKVAEYLASVVIKYGIKPDSLRLIGHSFGAHIAGLAAKKINAVLGARVKYCLGMDPAGIGFSKPYLIAAEKRMSSTDCLKTIALYTDGAFLGSVKPFAAFNVYANGGICQPECLCPPYVNTPLSTYPLSVALSAFYGFDLHLPLYSCPGMVRDAQLCFHFTAVRLTIESIRLNQTRNYPTIGPDRVFFTLFDNFTTPGRYNLTTTAFPPYSSP